MNKFLSKNSLDSKLIVLRDMNNGEFWLRDTGFFKNLKQKFGYKDFKNLLDEKKINIGDEIIVFYETIPSFYELKSSYNSNCGHLLYDKYDKKQFRNPITFLENISWFVHRKMGKLYYLDDYR